MLILDWISWYIDEYVWETMTKSLWLNKSDFLVVTHELQFQFSLNKYFPNMSEPLKDFSTCMSYMQVEVDSCGVSQYWHSYHFTRANTKYYLLDVLWGQPIKLIQVVSSSEFYEYWWNDVVGFFLSPQFSSGPQKQEHDVGHNYYTV